MALTAEIIAARIAENMVMERKLGKGTYALVRKAVLLSLQEAFDDPKIQARLATLLTNAIDQGVRGALLKEEMPKRRRKAQDGDADLEGLPPSMLGSAEE